MSHVRRFYDELAPDYHEMFRDWDAAIEWQAKALNGFIGSDPKTILDCACGIGTQAIGLALAGHKVTGSDLSPVAITRAQREAAQRGVRLPCCAADMRRLPFRSSGFDVVLCADNAVAHLLTAEDVVAGLSQMRRVLVAGGRLVLTMRGDYLQLRRERRSATLPQMSTGPGGRTVSFQLWDWHSDGEHYDLEHIQLHDLDGERRVSTRRTTSWALSQQQVSDFARQAGFTDVAWYEPGEAGYYQHVMTARCGD